MRCAIFIFLTAGTVAAWADRPLTIDDAYPLATGSFAVETGMAYQKDSRTTRLTAPLDITYGLVRRVEVTLGLGGQMEQREKAFGEDSSVGGLGDLVAQAQVQLINDGILSTVHAASFSVKFPTANHRRGLGSGRVDYDANWLISKTWNERWATHLNAGYTWVGDTRDEDFSNLTHYGIAAEYRIHKKLQLVAELFGDAAFEEGKSGLSGNLGVRWTVHPELILDAAFGGKLAGPGADLFATIGLAWTFDLKRRR